MKEIYDISYKDIISNITSLFYELKDSTIPCNEGTELSYVKTTSPLFYNKVIDASSNAELLTLITSAIPYYYIEPQEMIFTSGSKNVIENILQDTRDSGINDVPSIFQNSDFWNTWFRDTWGTIQNSMLLDIYNKLQYPFINENHFLNMSLFPKLAENIYLEELNDSESWIQFMDTEEENESVYKKDYPFLNEEIGCLDYIEDIIGQKTLSNYFIIDYSSSQNELLDKWATSLYYSGQLDKETLDMEKTVFKLQDCKNELIRRKFSGSLTLFQTILESLGRKGSYITTCTVSDINAKISISSSSSALTSFNNKRKCKLVSIPGLTSEYYDFTNRGDIIDTFYTKLGEIPLNTLLPVFYTSATIDNVYFNIDKFLEDKTYRNQCFRDNSSTIDWTNLKGINFIENIASSYDTLDMAIFNEKGEKENITLDSDVYENDVKVKRYLDRHTPLVSPKYASSGVADINTDRILYHQNTLQSILKEDYPYVTYPFADGYSLSLMDSYWLDYLEREMKKKSKAQDFFKVGAQINTLLKLEDNKDDRTTTYSFFGISYTSKDSKESNLDSLELEEYSENTKYALLWYCTVTYTVDSSIYTSISGSSTITSFTKTLISKIKLRPSEDFLKRIPSKYRDDDGTFEKDYKDYLQYNLGVLPNTYSFAKDAVIWNNDIGFSNVLTTFDEGIEYFELKNGEYLKVTDSKPNPNKIYYIKNKDTFEEAMAFSDDTEELGYSKARFVFSDKDIILNGTVNSLSLTVESESSNNIFGFIDNSQVFNDSLCSVYPSKDTKIVFYTMERFNSLGETTTYWSDPIKVVNLCKLSDYSNATFTPDWMGLEYHLNPYLNFVKNSASPLRRYKGYSVADLLKDELPLTRNFSSSYETALCNLNRTRGRLVLCNDSGSGDLNETVDTYGYFLDRVPLYEEEPLYNYSISESSIVKGDNRKSVSINEVDSFYDTENLCEIINTNVYLNPEDNIEVIKEQLDSILGKNILYTVIIYENESRINYKIRYFLVRSISESEVIKEQVDYDKITNDRYSVYRDFNNIECIKVCSNKTTALSNVKWADSFYRIVPFSHKSKKTLDKSKWHWNQDKNGYNKTLGIHISFEDVNFVEFNPETLIFNNNVNDYVVKDKDTIYVYQLGNNLKENNMTLIKDKNVSLIITSKGKVKFEALGVSVESDRVLPLDNLKEIPKVNLRIFSSVKEEGGSIYLTLCVNNSTYTNSGTNGRDYQEVEYIELFAEPKKDDENKDPIAINCFYGNVYEIALYNEAKSSFNLEVLSHGLQRELFSLSPSNYKLAHNIYRDFAFLKKNIIYKSKSLPKINTVRIFNRSVWDSIMVDNYPVTDEELREGSLFYNKEIKASDPYDDTDVYAPIIKGDDIIYHLSDCIEQELIDKFEVFNNLSPKVSNSNSNLNSLSILYNNTNTVLNTDSEVQIVNTLIEPISYNDYPMKSSDKLVFYFDSTTQSIKQLRTDQPDEVDNFIVVPSKGDSSDDSFEYSAELDFSMYMYPEFDASKWLSKGANITLGYNKSQDIFYAKLSDNSIKSSEKNNILLPLVIPPQPSSLKANGDRERRIFLDRFVANNLLLSNMFKTFLDATSYYTELRIPYAVNTVNTVYEKSLGKRLYLTENQEPVQGRTYYKMKHILSVGDLKPIYAPEYVNEDIFEWTGKGNPPLGLPTPEESIYFVKTDSMKRGVTYYRLSVDNYFIPLKEFTPFNDSYTDDSLYFTLEDDYFVPYNKDYFDVNGTYYHEDKGIYPYEKFELLSKAPSDRDLYDSKLELLYNSDNKSKIFIKDTKGNFVQFTEDYFSKDTDYYIGEYIDNKWVIEESTLFRFTDETSYFEKVIIGEKEYHNRLSVFSVEATIYSMKFTKIEAGSKLSPNKAYYEYKDKEYVIAEGTYFDTESEYYEDKLGDKNFYKLVNGNYEKIKSESPTYENWNVDRDGYIYDKISTSSIEYINKWDALRTLKEGTYYFTCKYPLQILPFKEDELDLPNRKYSTYYASTRFKVVVTSELKVYSEEDYAIEGYPIKYQSDNLEATLKSDTSIMHPSDNRTFPHRIINIDLYAIDCTEVAGIMKANGTEDYNFQWKKIASNHPTEEELDNNIIILDKEAIETDTFIKQGIPLFLSKSYTSSFFIAGSDKSNNRYTPNSADDDFIYPIEILDGDNDLSKESLEYSDSLTKSLVLLSGKTYQVLLDYDAYIGEMSYTSRVYNNFADEKVNFARLVNLLDSSTVSENEYLYNTDGRSFNSTEISAIIGNTGFKIKDNSTDTPTWDTVAPYFGNPYSKMSSANVLLRNKKAIEGLGLSGKDSRLNINNSYNFPYSVESSSHTIPAYIDTIGAVSPNSGSFIEMDIKEMDILKYHYDNLKSNIVTSITSLKGNSEGLFSGISKISPNLVNFTKNLKNYPSVIPYIGLHNSNYDIYGYSSSRRIIPSGDKDITITRRSLYSNNLLETNSFDMKDIWTVTNGIGYYTQDTSMDKDVFCIRPYIWIWKSSTTKLDYSYGRGGVKYTSKFEVAINLKGNISKVKACFTVAGKKVTSNYDGNNYLGEIELTSTPMEGNYNGWNTYSAETSREIDADSVTFEIESTGPFYVASAFVRKCNFVSHKLGLADALNTVILTSGLSGVTLKEHSSVIVNQKDSENIYYPIQFNNTYVKSISSGGNEIYRPISGVSKVAEFISNYKDTVKKVKDTRLQSLIIPWRRKLYITYSNGDASVSVHKYSLLPNYLGALELQEVYDNTSDIIDTLGEEVIGGEKQKKLQITLEKNPVSNNFNIFFDKIPLVLNSENCFKKFECNLRLNKRDNSQDAEALILKDEKFSVIFNAFNPVAYREQIDKPLAITNVQLLYTDKSEQSINYELEYLPIVYSELRNHISLNTLFYIK